MKLWMTGYSRSAATANLAAARLDRDSFAEMYVYTFATPSGTTQPKVVPGVFNIVYDEDLIPNVAMKEWGFGKNGTTLRIAGSSSSIKKGELEDVQREFASIVRYSGAAYNPKDYIASSAAYSEAVSALMKIAPDAKTYAETIQPYLMPIVQYLMCRSDREADSQTRRIELRNEYMAGWITEKIPEYPSMLETLHRYLKKNRLLAGAGIENAFDEILKQSLKATPGHQRGYVLMLLALRETKSILTTLPMRVANAAYDLEAYVDMVLHILVAGEINRDLYALSETNVARTLARLGKKPAAEDRLNPSDETISALWKIIAALPDMIPEVSRLFQTNVTPQAVSVGHSPETYLSWLQALTGKQLFDSTNFVRFDIPLLARDSRIHGEIRLADYAGFYQSPVMFFSSKVQDRVLLLRKFRSQTKDLLVFVPADAAEELVAQGGIYLDQAMELEKQYPHAYITYQAAYIENKETVYTDTYGRLKQNDQRRVIWLEGQDGRMYLAVFDRYYSYMGVGLEPTSAWFYVLSDDGKEFQPFTPEIPFVLPPGASGQYQDINYISTTEISSMDITYDERSDAWYLELCQWGWDKYGPGMIGTREKTAVRNLFQIRNKTLIPAVRSYYGIEFERWVPEE